MKLNVIEQLANVKTKHGIRAKKLTAKHFHKICDGESIATFVEPFPGIHGFYTKIEGGLVIVINSDLRPRERLRVMFHELGHHFLHGLHSTGNAKWKEDEADMFADMATRPIGY